MWVFVSIATAWIIVMTIHAWEQWYYPRLGIKSYRKAQKLRERMEAVECRRRRSLGYS